jgi:prepilin-type N-terminal cleavage/methylation domain-containing protein
MRLSHRGFTVAELLVAVAVGGIATAVMTATVVRQQRFYSSASEVLDVRSQMRDAADILAADIRGAAIDIFGLPVMTDTAVEIVTVIATSVACAQPSGTAIGLPPQKLVAGNTLTSILVQPDTGDIALVYSADSSTWEIQRIASFSSYALSAVCPSSTGFTSAGDAFTGATGFKLILASAPSAGVHQGAPIHFVRRARYSFYKSSDAKWYLGYRRCGTTAPFTCASIQPVSGPYRPYRANSPPGISFRYLDGDGAPVTSAAQSFGVTRVEIVFRGETAHAIALTGDTRREWQDSAIVTVAARNRKR